MRLQPIPAMPLRAELCGPEVHPSVPVITGQLHVRLMVEERGWRPVHEGDLLAWNATMEELLAVALERLVLTSGDDDWMVADTVPGLALLHTQDGLASSRALVLPRLLGDWPLAGVVVAVPTDNQLVALSLHGLEDLESLAVMVAATQLAAERAEHPLSSGVFWTDGVRWHALAVREVNGDYEVELPEPARRAVHQLAAMGLAAMVGEA